MDSVMIECELSADPATVYRWFIEPALLTRWWPTEAETDARPGGAYRMFWAGPDVTLQGQYVALDPGRRLEFTWSWAHDDLPPRHVAVSFGAGGDAGGDGTALTVVHECASEAEGDDYRDGWQHFLGRLDDELRA